MDHPVTLLALSQKSTRPDITGARCDEPPAGVYVGTSQTGPSTPPPQGVGAHPPHLQGQQTHPV